MYFTEITLENFRNYTKETVLFHPKVNIITGQNAQGKTNLIEALSLMSIGKSFRTGKDSEMIRFQEEHCRVKATFIKNERENKIEFVIAKDGKAIKIDGCKAQRNSDLLEGAYIVVFSPEDLKIVKDEPEKRRRFIDRELCQLRPVYYKALGKYKKILQQRNALLRQESFDEENLTVWDRALAEYGSSIVRDRSSFIKTLDGISRELHTKITSGKERLELQYEPNFSLDENEELSAMRERFFQALVSDHRQDKQKRATTTGPHKDDIKILVNDIDIRHYGSQGQQRTAALAMKLAEIRLIKEEKGEDPILLLDDVLSELDEERRWFLLDSLSDVQLFLTTTELDEPFLNRLAESRGYLVNSGRIEKMFDIKME